MCVICPNDLMILHPDLNQGLNREPEMCSECYACVKLCPQDAIGVRGMPTLYLLIPYQRRAKNNTLAKRDVR